MFLIIFNFSRLENLLKESNGKIIFEGGTPDRDDLYIPPVLIDISTDDVLMKSEVTFLNYYQIYIFF